MGFSLSAFGAGLATAASEKFEEERKLAQAAVVGRISRAAEINKRKLKETTELRSSLETQLADIEQVVGPDETLQKAFLTSPTAYATYKEQKLKGEALDPYQFITINKDKLFTGAPKDFISKLTQEAAAPVAAAMPTMPTAEEKPASFFAPSTERIKGYTENAAMAAGMTPEELKSAESYTGLKKIEPVATINFDTLRAKKIYTVEDRIKESSADAADALMSGNTDKFNLAKERVDMLRTLNKVLKPEEVKWADYVGQLKLTMLKGSPEDKTKASEEYNRVIKIEELNDKKKGEGESKIPAEGALSTLFKTAGTNAVTAKYGKSLKDDLIVTTDPYGNSSFQYVGTNPAVQADIQDTAKAGIANVASLYTTPKGVPLNRSVAAALMVNGIKLGEGGAAAFPSGPRTTTVPPPATGGAPVAGTVSADKARIEANDAIKKGGNRAAIAARFKSLTGQEL